MFPPNMFPNMIPNMRGMNPMQLMNVLKSARNPQQVFEQMLQQNPNANNVLMQLRNSTNNAPPEQIAMQLAQQRGMSKEQVMQMYNSIKKH